ncbi:hypothetical protein L2E82_47289 [Cichorium intybus]|uniref:Uncharacterized protein n=1 Tax=Cichorium intybus TaxID=13427 RepID=A0ACB8YZ92_CICIN|nr:hypothetical protein L2E82_47289 [Cichorium intybus]
MAYNSILIAFLFKGGNLDRSSFDSHCRYFINRVLKDDIDYWLKHMTDVQFLEGLESLNLSRLVIAFLEKTRLLHQASAQASKLRLDRARDELIGAFDSIQNTPIVLNQIVYELPAEHPLPDSRPLRELLGHTPPQSIGDRHKVLPSSVIKRFQMS